jgi:hypothetical protein
MLYRFIQSDKISCVDLTDFKISLIIRLGVSSFWKMPVGRFELMTKEIDCLKQINYSSDNHVKVFFLIFKSQRPILTLNNCYLFI